MAEPLTPTSDLRKPIKVLEREVRDLKRNIGSTSDVTATTLSVGGGTTISKIISNTTAWDIPSLADGATATLADIALTGVSLGDHVMASHSSIVAVGWYFSTCVTDTNTVSVLVKNSTGSTQDLASGTLRVTCIKFSGRLFSTYLRPDGVSTYKRPDGTSYYIRP